jgi:hypothetical protein
LSGAGSGTGTGARTGARTGTQTCPKSKSQQIVTVPQLYIYLIVLDRHSKEDEEIYKEFMEINNELIPHVFKTDGKSFSSSFPSLQQVCQLFF